MEAIERRAEKGFEVFFRENENVLYKIVKGYVKKEEDAREIVLDSMMIVFERWERVKDMENPIGYLVRVGIHKAKRHLIWKGRSSSRNRQVFLEEYQSVEEIVDGDCTPEEKVLRKEQRGWILKQIGSLKERERNVVVLRDFEEKKFEEISLILKMKLPTVKSLYRRAKIKIAKKWEATYAV